MKRRAAIILSAALLYAGLMAVTWIIGTRQAAEKTEAQLDYAILDFRSTIGGAIDTMLGYVAKSAVRRLEEAAPHSLEEMSALARHLDMDEINVVDRDGNILASNDPNSIGKTMLAKPDAAAFMVLTNGVAPTYSQPFRASIYDPSARRKYLGAAFPGGNGFVQVGLDESHLSRMLPDMLGYIFDEWLLGRTGFFLCADAQTDRLISNPSRHRDEAETLSGAGFDAEAALPFVQYTDDSPGETFVQRLFGETCYCRCYVFGGHLFIPALPEREYYDTRSIFITVFAVLLFAVLAVFVWLLDRIFSDSDRLRAFYSAQADSRAKEMRIATTIQTAALPNAFPVDPRFSLFASMHAAREVGGDFYDHFPLDESHYAFLVADVSGKGITGALYMMTAKTLMKDTLLALHDPAATLTKVNAELCRNNPAGMFLTAWVGVIDLETGIVTFANAGHNPPVVVEGGCDGDEVRHGAEGEGLPARMVCDKSGPVLAFLDNCNYRPRTLALKPGDTLFLYTDGVTEALDRQNRLFGDMRLLEAMRTTPSAEPSVVCSHLRVAVTAFANGAPQADDMTILALQRLTPPRAFSRSFPPTQAGIAAATEFLETHLSEATELGDAAPKLLPTLAIILDEIASNIVKHSCASAFEMDLEVSASPRRVTLVFRDDGVAYDPLSHIDPDTTLPAEARPIGGLGILMVKRMSDAISYSRVRNRNFLTVVKNV